MYYIAMPSALNNINFGGGWNRLKWIGCERNFRNSTSSPKIIGFIHARLVLISSHFLI